MYALGLNVDDAKTRLKWMQCMVYIFMNYAYDTMQLTKWKWFCLYLNKWTWMCDHKVYFYNMNLDGEIHNKMNLVWNKHTQKMNLYELITYKMNL